MCLNEPLHRQIAVQGSVIDALREAIVRQIADARAGVNGGGGTSTSR